jgi:hypothetical protein
MRDGWQQLGAFSRDNKREMRVRKILAQGTNRWRSQNQIADSLELEKKDFHGFLQGVAAFEPPLSDREGAPP